MLFELAEKPALEAGLYLLHFRPKQESLSLHGLFSGMDSHLCVEKERSSKQPKNKSVLSLRATGRSTIPNTGYCCVSCGIHVSGVGKRSHRFIGGRSVW